MKKYIYVALLMIAGVSSAWSVQGDSVLSPDGQSVLFVNYKHGCPWTEDMDWFPIDSDDLWLMNADGSKKRCIVKNNYSKDADMNNYLGSFEDLHWSPDGKYIYFLCQNCASNAILYRANADGANIKKLSHAHGIGGVVGGNPKDEYYGYILVHMKKYLQDQPNRWVTVLMTPDGKEVKEINSPDDLIVARALNEKYDNGAIPGRATPDAK